MRYLIVLLLVGCAATPEERAEKMIATHGPVCDRIGFKRDTESWRNCVVQQESGRQSGGGGVCTKFGATTVCN